MSDSLPSTIVEISTVQHGNWPNLTWVLIETADGMVGIGETFFMSDAVAAYLHETVRPYLVGRDAAAITAHWTALYRQWSRSGIGVEARGASAIDIALWDLLGKRTGLPLYQLLGGKSRDAIRAYNTCGGPYYARDRALPRDRLYGDTDARRSYEDLWAFQHQPAELAKSLLDMGFAAMKIWPFDVLADETGGQYITPAQLRSGLQPLDKIREAVGDDMDIALEMHGKWNLPAAVAIARAVEEFRPMWIEDPIKVDNLRALGQFTRSTGIPTLVGESLGARFSFQALLEQTDVAFVMADPGWVGGLTEVRRVADLAGVHQRPFTPHDCTGPVNLAVGVHLCINIENAFLQEMVRAYYFGWYADIVSGLPVFEGGLLRPTENPGHGVILQEAFLRSPACSVRGSTSGGSDL